MIKRTRKKTKRSSWRSVQPRFPESNRLTGQLRILCRTMLPFLGAVLFSSFWRLKSRAVLCSLRVRSFFERRRMPAPTFLAASLAISAVAVFLSIFTLGTTVTYNGNALGVVASATDADAAVSGVEEELSSVLGDFSIDMSLVSYSTGLVSRRSVVWSDRPRRQKSAWKVRSVLSR